MLPGGLGLDARTAAPGPAALPAQGRAPGRLNPAAWIGPRGHQAGPTYGGDVGRRRRELHPVAIVPAADGDRHAGVVEIRTVVEILAGVLVAAVAVRDDRRAPADRGVLGRAEIVDRIRIGLHEQDVAVRTDRRNHFDIEGDLAAPASVRHGVARPAVLVDLLETAVGRGARVQAKLAAIGGQVGFGRGQVIGIDDCDGDS